MAGYGGVYYGAKRKNKLDQAGGSKYHFLHTVVKERIFKNAIRIQVDDDGNEITDEDLVKVEIRRFYSQLLSTRANYLIDVDIILLSKG